MYTTHALRHAAFGRTLLAALCLAFMTARPARADGLIIPHVGINFGGDAGQELGDAFEAKRLNWGTSFVFMGGGVFGVEGDVAYSPDFFGKTDAGGSGVLTVMGNLILGVPFGGQEGFGVRPYALVGLGLVRATGEAFDNALSFNENKIGWDFGGGLMIFFGSHVGIRGDVRYVRTAQASDFLDFSGSGDAGNLDFGRGSLGLILRF